MKRTLSLLLALACTGTATAAEPALITLTPLQLERAGVETAPAQAATRAGGGTETRLSGIVIVPNSGLELASAPLAGVLQRLRVDPLDVVRAGQPLAEIQSTEYVTLQQGYLEALAAAQVARTRADRDAELFKDGIIAGSRNEETQAGRLQAEALLEEHRQGLTLAGLTAADIARLRTAQDIRPVLVITAGKAGSVLEQLATPGQRLEAGAPIFRIAETSRLAVELNATSTEGALIRAGDVVTVAGCERSGRVVSVGSHVSNTNQSIVVRAEFESPGACLRPNQFVEARVASGTVGADAVGLPASAVVRSEGQDYVFLREGSGFRPTPVTIVARGGATVWIRGGNVPAGGLVATRGIAALRGAWIGLGPETPATDAGTP